MINIDKPYGGLGYIGLIILFSDKPLWPILMRKTTINADILGYFGVCLNMLLDDQRGVFLPGFIGIMS